MDIKEFLKQSAGKWFSQRTRYDLNGEKAENNKSDLVIEILSEGNPELVQFCQQNQLDPQLIILGKKISWDNSVDWGKTKDLGSAIVFFLLDSADLNRGKIMRSDNSQPPQFIPGRYLFGEDEALTLILETETFSFEERIWFASPNLRLRTTVLKNDNEASKTTFYSEIRRVS